MAQIPSVRELLVPTLVAMRSLGRASTLQQINARVIADLDLGAAQREMTLRKPGRRTKLEERLAWSRSYLKSFGAADNPTLGSWKLTELGVDLSPQEIPALLKSQRAAHPRRRNDKRLVDISVLERLLKIEVWMDWTAGELAGIATRVATLEGKVRT